LQVKQKLSGDDYGFGKLTETERKTGKNALWCGDRVNDGGMKGEGSFEQTDTHWAQETTQ